MKLNRKLRKKLGDPNGGQAKIWGAMAHPYNRHCLELCFRGAKLPWRRRLWQSFSLLFNAIDSG